MDEFSIEKQHAAVLRIYKILKPTNFSNKYEAEIVQLNSKIYQQSICKGLMKLSLRLPLREFLFVLVFSKMMILVSNSNGLWVSNLIGSMYSKSM